MNSGEKQELRVIGVALAYIEADVYTNDLNIEAGLAEAGGVVGPPLEDTEEYDAVITYRVAPKRRLRGADAFIRAFPDLKMFSEVAVKSIYQKGFEP